MHQFRKEKQNFMADIISRATDRALLIDSIIKQGESQLVEFRFSTSLPAALLLLSNAESNMSQIHGLLSSYKMKRTTISFTCGDKFCCTIVHALHALKDKEMFDGAGMTGLLLHFLFH